jgi:hypothetical protein
MATLAFESTFKIKTKYGIKNFKKALDKSSSNRKSSKINIQEHFADKKFIEDFMKNTNEN